MCGFSIKGGLWPLLQQGLPAGEMQSSGSAPSAVLDLGATACSAEQEMVPCKQWLIVKENTDCFQTSLAIFFGEFYS